MTDPTVEALRIHEAKEAKIRRAHYRTAEDDGDTGNTRDICGEDMNEWPCTTIEILDGHI